MQEVILVIHLFIALAIIIIVMVQPSESGGFLGSGSMSNMLAPRRRGDVLTRATMILAGCFFVTSLALAILANQHPANASILDEAAATPAIDAPAVPPADSALKDNDAPTTSAIPADEKHEDKPAEDKKADSKTDDKKPAADEAPKAPIAK